MWLATTRSLAVAATSLLALCPLNGHAATPELKAGAASSSHTSEELTAAQWRADLRFLASEMNRRHKNLYHSVDRQTFDAAVAELDQAIPRLKRNQIIVGMMRIAALVGDGHTRIDAREDPQIAFRSLPVRFYLFDDGLYIRAADAPHSALVGARVAAFNGMPSEEALRRAATIISKDNPMGVKLFAPVYLGMPEILQALGLSERSSEAALTLVKDGRTWTVRIPATAVAQPWPDDTDGSFINPEGWVDARQGGQSLWLQAPLDFHRLIPLSGERALYTQLNEVSNIKGETLAQYGQRIRDAARANEARTLIVDLRLNFGGNMDLRNGYIRELIKAEGDDTQLFVISGRGSFSATEALLVDLRRLTKAVFLGEPASSKPNSYGDGYRSKMPNSGVEIITSIQWNQLSGQSKAPWTGVDIATPFTFADYVAGRDPAVEAALHYTSRPSLFDQLLSAAKEHGAEAAVQALTAYEANPENRYQDIGLQAPRAADALYVAKQPAASFAVAQRAAQDYPTSVDAWLVLAYIANLTDHAETALLALNRTLELAPDNRPARDLAEKIRK